MYWIYLINLAETEHLRPMKTELSSDTLRVKCSMPEMHKERKCAGDKALALASAGYEGREEHAKHAEGK